MGGAPDGCANLAPNGGFSAFTSCTDDATRDATCEDPLGSIVKCLQGVLREGYSMISVKTWN